LQIEPLLRRLAEGAAEEKGELRRDGPRACGHMRMRIGETPIIRANCACERPFSSRISARKSPDEWPQPTFFSASLRSLMAIYNFEIPSVAILEPEAHAGKPPEHTPIQEKGQSGKSKQAGSCKVVQGPDLKQQMKSAAALRMFGDELIPEDVTQVPSLKWHLD
jgi:hypothetical protein